MKKVRITNDFLWLVVNDKAKELFATGLFEIYRLFNEESEGLCESIDDINEAIEQGNDLAIEVCQLSEILDCEIWRRAIYNRINSY